MPWHVVLLTRLMSKMLTKEGQLAYNLVDDERTVEGAQLLHKLHLRPCLQLLASLPRVRGKLAGSCL